MAFVNDDVGKMVFRVKGGEKGGIAVFRFYAKRLVGGDMDSCVSGIVHAVCVAIDFCRIGAENVLEGGECLGTKFVTVADEERTGKLPGV